MDESDDLELAESLGIIPATPKPPLKSTQFDTAHALTLPPRERFDSFLALFNTIQAEREDYFQSLRKLYYEELEDLWRQTKKRGRRKFDVTEAETELGAACHPLIDRARLAKEAHRVGFLKAKDMIADALRVSADEIEIRPGDTRVLYREVDEASYRTQTNSNHYARARAELHAENLAAMGINPEVKYESRIQTYRVYTTIYGGDIALLDHKSGAPFPYLVRRSWQLGANPRVYWSFLEHGYEAKHGFDMFGRDLIPTTNPNPSQNSETGEPEPI